MFDPQNMPSSAGGFPWKADGDYTTVVYIKNETDVARKFVSHLVYEGGQYSMGIRELKPGETVGIDFRELRDNQSPGSQENVIPLDVDSGQIARSVLGAEDKVLSGRSEQISVADGVASTYACANCCPNVIDGVYVNPTFLVTEVSSVTQFTATQTEQNCYFQQFGPYQAYPDQWNSFNYNVATVDFAGNSEGVGVGDTNIQGCVERTIWYNWGGGYCEPVSDLMCDAAPVEVRPNVTINELGFTGDYLITKWPPTNPDTVIDNPDGSTPTWKSSNNPDLPVAYPKEGTVTMFAKLGINPSVSSTNAKIRVKNGSTVIASKDISISGTSVTITGISTTSPLESTVKTTTTTFTWEISYNGGDSWSSMGNSGPHTIHWTYAAPLSPSFKNDAGTSYTPLYDLALQKACGYANATIAACNLPSDLSTTICKLNKGVDGDINYQPSRSIGAQHPLDAYSTTGGCQCSDLANLLRGLLRSIGIDGTTRYIWAGPNSSTLRAYVVGSTGKTPSFRITKAAREGSTEVNPHFRFHAVVSANGTWYDPSFGDSYSSLSFIETAFNNTPQQVSSSFWSSETASGFVCPH